MEEALAAGAAVSETLRALALALIQGLSEFLPVSSAAHLILPAQLLGWPDQGLAFDVAVHVGSLLAVLAYFRRDLAELASGGARALRRRRMNDSARLLCYLAAGTVPVGLAGLLARDVVAGELRDTAVIAVATIFFGALLGLADRLGGGDKPLSWRAVCAIGAAQALAIIPGASRSGVTMTAALFCGLGREAAARFSFLLAIPAISLAGAFQLWQLLLSGAPVDWRMLALGTLAAAVAAYLCVYWFLALIGRVGFMPFVIYRLLLGGVLLLVAWRQGGPF